MAKIRSEQKSEKVYYGDEPLHNFWLKIPASASGISSADHLAELKQYLDFGITSSVVCVFSEHLSSRELCMLLAKIRDNGNRVYIITNELSDEMKNLDGCLIRYGGRRKIGSFLLINPNSDVKAGCIFTGRFNDGGLGLKDNLLLNLDAGQISVLFRYFCYHFWKLAETERIGSEKRKIESAPVDIYPPSGDSCDFQYLRSVWEKETIGAMITTSLSAENSFLNLSVYSGSNIFALFSSVNDNTARLLNDKENKLIALDGVCLINSVKTSEGAWLVPKIDVAKEDEVYAIKINSEQAKELNEHIIKVFSTNTQYRYTANEIRKNLAGKNVVNLGDTVSQDYQILVETPVNLGVQPHSELYSKDQFESFKPVFNDDGRSVSIIFEWINQPFTLPKGSVKHQLYSQWENARNSIIARIDQILSLVSESEKREKTISSKIKQLFLGKQQKFKEYRDKLEDFKQISFAFLNTDDLRKNIKDINEIHAKAASDAGEIAEEDRKAHIQEQIDQNQKEKAALEAQLSAKEKEITDIKNARQKISDAYYAKGYIDKDASLAGFRKELENHLEAVKKERNKKSNNEEAQATAEIEVKLSETKLTIKNIEEFNIKTQKLDNDISSLRKDVERKTGELSSLQNQLKSPENKNANDKKTKSVLAGMKGGSGKNVSATTDLVKDLNIPSLNRLPAIGELYQNSGNSFLAITQWEEYGEGKEEAARLNAILCAKGEI
jgi:hypothetical protein